MAVTLLLHGRHMGPTVRYEPLGPWIVPWRFHAFEEEYAALRSGAGLIDYSTQAVLECRGADRTEFLQRLLTNDVARLSPGAGCQAALLTPSAKLIAAMLVLADPDALWLVCDLRCADALAQALDTYLFSEQVTVIPHERRKAVLALQGPRAVDLLTQLSGTAVALPSPGDHAVVRVHETPLRVIRHSLAGGSGVLCVVDADQAEALWELLRRRGAPLGLRLVGWEALNTARIEAGLPWFGIDMDGTNLLPETGLSAVAVSDTKGCYIGQEVVARMRTFGSPSKKLMALLIEGDEGAEVNDRLVRNGEEVGWVTSACRSPALQRPIAMGYVKRGTYEPGTPVDIARGDERLTATVAERPPVIPLANSA